MLILIFIAIETKVINNFTASGSLADNLYNLFLTFFCEDTFTSKYSENSWNVIIPLLSLSNSLKASRMSDSERFLSIRLSQNLKILQIYFIIFANSSNSNNWLSLLSYFLKSSFRLILYFFTASFSFYIVKCAAFIEFYCNP